MAIDLSAPPVPFSFEVYPPRRSEGMPALQGTIRRLADLGPRFISVTYGAGGSTGGPSLEVLRYIRTETPILPLAHLTCVGTTYAGAVGLIREFLDAGISSFLALRGDPPAGRTEDDVFLGDLHSAADLARLIARVQAEHAPGTEGPVPGRSGSSPITTATRADIAVAAFPNGHPRSRHPFDHIDALVAKQAAGATLAITQVFFHAEDYLAFVESARAAGVTIPILPGIMPVTSPARLRRVLELSGEAMPEQLAAALAAQATSDGQREAGVAYAAALSRAVLAGGAPGLHLYAFNDHAPVLAVLREAGVVPSAHPLEAPR